MSNLDSRLKVQKRGWLDIIKKWRETIAWVILALTAVGVGVNSGVDWWETHKDDINTIIPSPEPTNLKQETSKEKQRFSASFSNGSVTAELAVPDRVEPYKLVRITSTDISSFYDLLIMGVQNNQIHFIEAVRTARQDNAEFVFVGPPGTYSIRLLSFDQDTGFKVTTGSVIIGDPQPSPNQPTIAFTVIPDTINVGQVATLSWTTTNSNTVTLNGVSVSINGTQTVNPVSSGVHSYTLTAVGPGGTTSKTVTLNVTNNPTPDPVFNGKFGLDKLSYEKWKKEIQPQYHRFASKLADNFDAVAAQAVSTSAFPTPNAMLTELSGRNRLTMENQTNIDACMVFFNAWAAKAAELNKANILLNTKESYAEAFRETALGLRAVLGSQTKSHGLSFDEVLERDHQIYKDYVKATNFLKEMRVPNED